MIFENVSCANYNFDQNVMVPNSMDMFDSIYPQTSFNHDYRNSSPIRAPHSRENNLKIREISPINMIQTEVFDDHSPLHIMPT